MPYVRVMTRFEAQRLKVHRCTNFVFTNGCFWIPAIFGFLFNWLPQCFPVRIDIWSAAPRGCTLSQCGQRLHKFRHNCGGVAHTGESVGETLESINHPPPREVSSTPTVQVWPTFAEVSHARVGHTYLSLTHMWAIFSKVWATLARVWVTLSEMWPTSAPVFPTLSQV